VGLRVEMERGRRERMGVKAFREERKWLKRFIHAEFEFEFFFFKEECE